MSEKFSEIGFTCDWIAATFDPRFGWDFVRDLTLTYGLTESHARPQRGYNRAVEYENGLRASWHSELETNGLHVQMSGAVLRWYYAQGRGWYEIMGWVKECKGRVSRVDLALDVKNSAMTPDVLCKPNLKPYSGRGRTPAFNVLSGGDGSWTIYVGRRTSDKFLRIYDKAKEQKDYDSDYIRVELECKGEVAHAVGWQFPALSEQGCLDMARTLIRGVADFNIPAWDAAMESDNLVLSIPQGRQRDTVRWLLDTCAPALAKEIKKRPKEPVIDQFLEALRQRLNELGLDLQ